MDEIICQVSIVKVKIPKRRLNKLLSDHEYLHPDDQNELLKKQREIQRNIFTLEHTLSLVNKILLRT